RGTPGRYLEELDWPPFYGFVQPYKGDPVAFTSAAYAPSFLTIPATSDGSPARTVSNTEAHETFLRTRLAVEELMADADRHLRFQGQCLPGPASFEELESERRWEWFEDTEEEERRRRASNLGSRRAPKPRPDRDATLVEPEVVSAVVFSTESHDTEGRVIDRKASSDQEFQSVFANHLRARRVARK
ncbi:MAG: hypothetical protein Q8Q14_16545, partial [Gemmatimonadales bacterium]|nr:hypothetical protein [Gemmatimonadales bacterium]